MSQVYKSKVSVAVFRHLLGQHAILCRKLLSLSFRIINSTVEKSLLFCEFELGHVSVKCEHNMLKIVTNVTAEE